MKILFYKQIDSKNNSLLKFLRVWEVLRRFGRLVGFVSTYDGICRVMFERQELREKSLEQFRNQMFTDSGIICIPGGYQDLLHGFSPGFYPILYLGICMISRRRPTRNRVLEKDVQNSINPYQFLLKAF